MFVSQENFWVYGLLEIGLVSRVYLWFGFLDLFFVLLDLMEIGFGCWIWIWGLLEIGLVASWTWEEHEEYFLLVFNLIFSSFRLCSSDMGLSSCLLGSCVCVVVIEFWLLGSCSCDG